jgi:chitodextrinase
MQVLWRSARHLSLLFVAICALICAAACGSNSPSGGGSAPTAPGNLTPTVVSATQINLSWTAATEMGGTISGYQIARCSGTNCSNFAQVGTSATATFNDTGLAPSTSYTYEVRAVDTSNNTGPYSTSATATTLAGAVPTAPANLMATAASSSQINLSWTASTEVGGAISGYQIARCSGTNCSNFAQVGTSATATFNDTGLASSTSYTYEVRAVDTSNNTGPYSTSATATTTSGASLSVLVVSPQNPVITDSTVIQAFTATGHYSDGSTQDLTATATWTSTNTGVATVNASGQATSVALPGGQNAGFTSIKAVMSGVTGVSILSVTNHTSNASGFAGVFTQHNDIGRTGQNLNETALTSAPFPGTFGKKFSQPVDGFIYGQPLYVPQVTIAGVKHNVIYVATENDSVYAFDADSNAGADANPLWMVTLLDAAHGAGTGAAPTNSSTDNPCTDLIPTIGVTSTPVIDPSTGTMYVESKLKENGNFFHRLHALDITTGAEKVSPPATITATVSGIVFDPVMHTNRPGLLLLNGIVYVAYASDCDNTPYHGWIFAYNAATLSQVAVFNESPESADTAQGGFWMSGAGIAADSSANIFIPSGNGDFDTVHVPAQLLGDTNMKLFMAGTSISLEDYFTPSDQQSLEDNDSDLGSGGVLLLPNQGGAHPQELVQVGKEGTIFLIDRNQMTTNNSHYCSGCASDTEIVQELQSEVGGMFSVPAYWNNNVYFWGAGDNLVAFPVTSGALALAPSSVSGTFLGYPGATPSISANGATNGIVWAIDSTNFGQPKNASPGPAVLHAYDATNVGNELYDSSVVAGDAAGSAVKYTVPTIANGKVYIGTQTELDVYGP